MKPLKLTDEQVAFLAVCAVCMAPLEREAVKEALESGASSPGTLMCSGCDADPEHAAEVVMNLGTIKAAEMAAERARKAGLSDYFEEAATEALMRMRNQQN